MGGFDYELIVDEKHGKVFWEALLDLAKQRKDPFDDEQYLYGLDWWGVTIPDCQYCETYIRYPDENEILITKLLPREITPTLWEYFEVEPPEGRWIFYFHEIKWLFHWPATFTQRIYDHFEGYGCEDFLLQFLVDGKKITEHTFGELESKFSEAGIEFTRSVREV